MTAPKRWLLWIAVSSEAQADEDTKDSLPTQERDLRAYIEKLGGEIVDVLIVPGFSRDYYNWDQFAKAARESKMKIDAPTRMIRHWERRDFDAIALRDLSRVGRKPSILLEFVSMTVDIGAEIHVLSDGNILKRGSYLPQSMMGAFAARMEVENLNTRREFGMRKRLSRGFPSNGTVPRSHRVIYDPHTGDEVEYVVNEEMQPLFINLAQLVIDGVPWVRLGLELYERFGHTAPNGLFYHPNILKRWLFTPTTWGHSSRMARTHFSKYERWVFDESMPIPEGVTVWRNTHPCVWPDEMAERLKSELIRRVEAIRGQARSKTTHLFSALVLCGQCGMVMRVNPGVKTHRMQCTLSTQPNTYPGRTCANTRTVNENKIKAFLNPVIEMILQGEDIGTIFETNLAEASAQLARVTQEIENLEEGIRTLIREQKRAAENLRGLYTDEINADSDRLRKLQITQTELSAKINVHNQNYADRNLATEEIRHRVETIESFWQQDRRVINQQLHRVFGKLRMVASDGEIVKYVESNRRKSSRF